MRELILRMFYSEIERRRPFALALLVPVKERLTKWSPAGEDLRHKDTHCPELRSQPMSFSPSPFQVHGSAASLTLCTAECERSSTRNADSQHR